MKTFPPQFDKRPQYLISNFLREVLMYASLRFMITILACLSFLSYCAPKASANTWSLEEEDLSISVSSVEEWSNFEWKVFRLEIQNKSGETEHFLAPKLLPEGLSETATPVSGRDINRMISGLTRFRTRGSWEASDREKNLSWGWHNYQGGNRTVNVFTGLVALMNTTNYIADSRKTGLVKDEGETISPIKDEEWNSEKGIYLQDKERKTRWYALKIASFQEIEAITLELTDSKCQKRVLHLPSSSPQENP